MPTPPSKRDYKHEYSLDKKTGKDKDHLMRSKARIEVEHKFGKAARKGRDVAHIKAISNGGTNALSNLEIEPKAKNAHFKRRSDHTVKE